MLSKNILQLIVLAFGILQAQCANRIVGGKVTDIANHPYVVQILIGGTNLCGGSLIKPTVVLTAAHCTSGKSPEEFIVIGGSTQLAGAGVKRRVKEVRTSEDFDFDTYHSDIAVLILESPMTGKNINTIDLCTSSPKPKTFSTVVGWGKTGEDEGASSLLREVQVQSISFSKCNQMYSKTLTGTMTCAASGGRDACSGDSGGPLIHGNKLCGIVSWGTGCARPGSPGVYTGVPEVKDIIERFIKV